MSSQLTRLADHCELITKGTTPTTLGFDFADSGVPFLRVQNIEGGSVNYAKDTLFIDQKTHQALERSQIQPGDVLVSIAGSIGRAGVVPDSAPALNCNQAVAIVRTRGTVYRPFLRHWLESFGAQGQMRGATVTGTISNLSLTQLGNLKLPLPSLPEQLRIADILDKADALRAKRRAALGQLDTLTQSIFLEMFGDPATNPHGFPRRPLASLVREDDTINYGVVQPGDDLDEDQGVPLVRVGDLIEGRVRHSELKRIAPSIEAAYKRSRLRGDEILVSCVGSIGVVVLADESVKGFNVARAVARVPVASTTNRQFLGAYLRTDFVQRYFTSELRTVSQPTLNIKQLSETPVIVPPIESQQKFAWRLSGVEKLRTAGDKSLRNLSALFGALQHRAFQGEL